MISQETTKTALGKWPVVARQLQTKYGFRSDGFGIAFPMRGIGTSTIQLGPKTKLFPSHWAIEEAHISEQMTKFNKVF